MSGLTWEVSGFDPSAISPGRPCTEGSSYDGLAKPRPVTSWTWAQCAPVGPDPERSTVSVLQFIVALKWPLFLLIVFGFVWWRVRRNPSLGQATRQLIEARNIRMNVGGQELELTRVEEAAAIAASSDETIAAVAAQGASADPQGDPDVLSIRREAIEQLMTHAATWGWAASQVDPQTPPEPVIVWDESGQPLIRTSPYSSSRGRMAAVQRRIVANLRARAEAPPDAHV